MKAPGAPRHIRPQGTVEYRYEADALLKQPGDVVVVERGRPRSLVISCPDGCGSQLTINLDPRSGKAWRLYQRGDEITLHPSVWRDSGCEAHFVVWRNRLLWCGPRAQDGDEPPYDKMLEAAVLAALTNEYQSADEIADALDEIPWEISRIGERLVKTGKARLKRIDGIKCFGQASESVPSAKEPTSPLVAEEAPLHELHISNQRESKELLVPPSVLGRLRRWFNL